MNSPSMVRLWKPWHPVSVKRVMRFSWMLSIWRTVDRMKSLNRAWSPPWRHTHHHVSIVYDVRFVNRTNVQNRASNTAVETTRWNRVCSSNGSAGETWHGGKWRTWSWMRIYTRLAVFGSLWTTCDRDDEYCGLPLAPFLTIFTSTCDVGHEET